MKETKRMNRIDEELKKELSHIISYELNNPHIDGLISVTKVRVTPDLRYARVYISMINEKSKSATLSALKKSSGYIRTEVAKRINLRTTPELVFEFDDSLEYGAKMDSIIKELAKEFKNEDKEDSEEN